MFKGSIVALVTPIKGGDVDLDALTRLLDWHLAAGTHALVVLGTTGESATLTDVERMTVLDHALSHVDGRLPVIAGTGSNATAKAIAYTRQAKSAGADAALIVTPYYNKPDQAGLLGHFSAIADAIDIPQMLYNVPGRTGCDLLSETVARLAKHPNVVALKDATGDMSRLTELLEQYDTDIALLSGDDSTTLDFMTLGGHGAISVTANVVPEHMAAMMQAYWAEDMDEARHINAAMLALHQNLFVAPNPVPAKWLLARMGKVDSDEVRLPLVGLSADYYEMLDAALAKAHTYKL